MMAFFKILELVFSPTTDQMIYAQLNCSCNVKLFLGSEFWLGQPRRLKSYTLGKIES